MRAPTGPGPAQPAQPAALPDPHPRRSTYPRASPTFPRQSRYPGAGDDPARDSKWPSAIGSDTPRPLARASGTSSAADRGAPAYRVWMTLAFTSIAFWHSAESSARCSSRQSSSGTTLTGAVGSAGFGMTPSHTPPLRVV